MVVAIPSDMRAAMLDGSHAARYVANVFYDGRPSLQNIKLSPTGSLTGKASSRIQTTGNVLIASDSQLIDGQGNSIAPDHAVDALATYGQEMVISREVYLGRQLIGSQSLGRFRITEVPTIEQTARRFGSRGARVIESTLVQCNLSDLLEPIDAANFLTFESPRKGARAWDEIKRLSPLPVVQTLTNPAVASTVIYEDNRLETLSQLMSIAGGVPHMTRTGALSARLADPVASESNYVLDISGTIKTMSRSMSNDFYNVVVVTTTIDGSEQVLATAKIEGGPLRWDGPAGARVYTRSAGLAKTRQDAKALAESVLASQIKNRVRTVSIECLPNVEVDLGDPLRATDEQTGRVEYGMVSGLSYPMNPTALMKVELETAVTT